MLLGKKGLLIYSTLIFINIIIVFAIHLLFDSEQIFYQTYGNQFDLNRIESIFKLIRKWQWLGYTFIPLLVLFRIFYTTIFLFIGIFFTALKVEFSKLFKIALLADFAYVLSAFAKLVILIFFKQVNTLNDLQFTPLSVMELLNNGAVDSLFIYPLSLLNVFELLYFLILAWLLVGVINEANEERQVNFGKSLKLVTASYGSGLLLWVVFVMFISLNLS